MDQGRPLGAPKLRFHVRYRLGGNRRQRRGGADSERGPSARDCGGARQSTGARQRRAGRCRRERACSARCAGEGGGMSQEDIEATKAPLMDHLIELRARLIKALIAFGGALVVCFFFAKQIYNVLVWPFVWVAGPGHSEFIYTALLEYFITQLKLAMFGAAFVSFPG